MLLDATSFKHTRATNRVLALRSANNPTISHSVMSGQNRSTLVNTKHFELLALVLKKIVFIEYLKLYSSPKSH